MAAAADALLQTGRASWVCGVDVVGRWFSKLVGHCGKHRLIHSIMDIRRCALAAYAGSSFSLQSVMPLDIFVLVKRSCSNHAWQIV